MAHKYIVTLTAGEDVCIVAECPSLPGCVSQGKTRDEALNNIREAIGAIIEVRKAQQLSILSPDIVEINVAAWLASLPVISGRQAVNAFDTFGFLFCRQEGSHMIL